MTNKRKTWGPSSLRQKKPQVPDSIKLRVKEKADEIIDNVLKPEHIKPPPTDNDFNYLVDIYSKWYRNYFYFCVKYNCPSPNAISPSFETKLAGKEKSSKHRKAEGLIAKGQPIRILRESDFKELVNQAEDLA